MADLFGSLVTNSMSRENQERAYQQQRELQADAQAYNTTMWHMANAYNSPIAQMQRFKSAGLNPNLIYGQMQQGAAAPSMSAGSAPAPAATSEVNLMETAQLGLLNAQKRNIEADTQLKQANAGESSANASLIETTEWINKESLRIQQELKDSQIEINDATIKQIEESINKLREETNNIQVQTALATIEKEFLQSSFDDRVSLVKAQLRDTIASANLKDAQVQRITTLLTQELNNLKAQFDNIVANTALTKEQRENLAQQKLLEAADNFYLMLANEYKTNGNWFQRNVGAVGAEVVHLFTHGLGLGKIIK